MRRERRAADSFGGASASLRKTLVRALVQRPRSVLSSYCRQQSVGVAIPGILAEQNMDISSLTSSCGCMIANNKLPDFLQRTASYYIRRVLLQKRAEVDFGLVRRETSALPSKREAGREGVYSETYNVFARWSQQPIL